MGTRHLIVVLLDNEIKIAQYGQWDGYPSGQGKTVLEFLTTWDRPLFEHKLRVSSFVTQEDIDQINVIIDNEHLTNNWQERWPEFSRDTGADILKIVQNSPPGIKLQDSRSFINDTVFCEWAYVIDLDVNTLSVHGNGSRVITYYLNDLPTVKKLQSDFE